MLLVRKDDLRCLTQERNFAQDVEAPRAMFAHDLLLSEVSAPGLRRISSGMAILPMSCKKRAAGDDLDLRR